MIGQAVDWAWKAGAISPIKGNVFCVSIILLYLSNKTSLNENRSRVEQNFIIDWKLFQLKV